MKSPRSKFTLINKALAGAAALCLWQGASAAEVAPYFHAWGGPLLEARQKAGMTSAVLAFAVTRGSCALDASFLSKLPDARDYVGAGNQLLISFGGHDGIYAEIACKDDNQLFALMEKVMNDTGTRRLDFDIEGYQLLNTEGTARRARVLARLQARYPDLSVTFTLPGWLRGFSAESMNLLNTTLAAGVRIDRVMVMVQTFGQENIRTMVTPSTVGQAAIVTFRAAANQLMTVFRDKTPAQLHAMMGFTPMIGRNDDGAILTLDDARTIADFAKLNGVGMISYWAFQRDRAQASGGAADINAFSGVAQDAYQYHSIFKSSGGTVAPAPTPTPSTAPAPLASTSSVSACNHPGWVMGRQYGPGSIVSYADGRQYIARHANPGYNPTISTYFWGPYLCGGSYTAAPAPAPAAAPSSCNHPSWVQGRPYAAGTIVTYIDGARYAARYANPGYNPTISTYFWTRHYC